MAKRKVIIKPVKRQDSSQSPAKVPAKKIGIIIIVLVGLALSAMIGAQRLNQLINPGENEVATPEEELTLPEGWKIQESSGEDERILFQAYKEVTMMAEGEEPSNSITPSVTVLVSPLPEGAEAEVYTQQLVDAAAGSLPSLEYTQNQFSSSENLSVRRLVGTLEMTGEEIGFKQQIYISGNDVYTFTALFPIDENSFVSTEVEIIFDQILGQLGL